MAITLRIPSLMEWETLTLVEPVTLSAAAAMAVPTPKEPVGARMREEASSAKLTE